MNNLNPVRQARLALARLIHSHVHENPVPFDDIWSAWKTAIQTEAEVLDLPASWVFARSRGLPDPQPGLYMASSDRYVLDDRDPDVVRCREVFRAAFEAVLIRDAEYGRDARRGRRRGGQRQRDNDNERVVANAYRTLLIERGSDREIAGIIARRARISISQVNRILQKLGLRGPAKP